MSLRIFIVEDHPVMREMLSDFLGNEAGFDVCGAAATAEEALDRLAEEDADLILLDVSLPKMNGIELLKKLRAGGLELPCLMLSGHGENGYVQRSLAAGAQGYIMKGDPYEISGAIQEVAGGGTYLSKPWRDR